MPQIDVYPTQTIILTPSRSPFYPFNERQAGKQKATPSRSPFSIPLMSAKQGNRSIPKVQVTWQLLNKFKPSLGYVKFESTVTATKQIEPKPFADIPEPPGAHSWPYLGLYLQMKPFTKSKHFGECIEKLYKLHGDIFKQRFWKHWMVCIADPADIETGLRNEGKYPFKPPMILSTKFDEENNLKPSLASLNFEEWRSVRLAAQQKMLRPKAVQNYAPMISEVANDFVDILKEKDRMEDTVRMMMNYATESVGMLCFNKRLGCLHLSTDSDELMFNVRQFFQLFGEHFFHVIKPYRWFKTPFYKKFERSAKYIYSIANKNIEEAMERIKNENEQTDEPNLLRELILDDRIGPADTQRILITLFNAGIESTSNNMACFLYHLAKNQEAQEQLYEEIMSKMSGSGQLDSDVLNAMPYMAACVKESMRLISPIILGTMRFPPEDLVLHGYKIPKWTPVQFCNKYACLDSKHFPDPMSFKPERWLRDEEGKRNVHPFVFLPFGFGVRNCLGQRFALQEMYICTAKMLQNFRLILPPGKENLEYTYRTFVVPLHPVEIILEKR